MAHASANQPASSTGHAPAAVAGHGEGVQHPIRIYLWIWLLLFVFSTASYFTDFLDKGIFRWALIVMLMLLKAGFIVAIFMHMAWERLALIALMAIEGDYTFVTRLAAFVHVQ